MSDNLPPNYNNGQPLEEIQFVSEGAFPYYRFGNITPGSLEELLIFGKVIEVEKTPVYYQRVYDASEGWCYYTSESNPNPSPAPNITSPNHTGNISDAQILNVVGLPER